MVSNLTAILIQGDDEVSVSTYHDDDTSKWGYTLFAGKKLNYRAHISSHPVFDLDETAKEEGGKMLREIRTWDLEGVKKTLDSYLGF